MKTHPRWIHAGRVLVPILTASLALAPSVDASGGAAALAGAFLVSSDPSSADVFVDGTFAGRTPITLSRLTAGDHRLRVAKDGYLENGRLLHLKSGRSEALQITLTPLPAGSSSTPDQQVNRASDAASSAAVGGGGKKKWLWIALAGGGAAAGAAYYLHNRPPVAGTIGVSPTAAGMAGATSFSFTAQGASDPNGDALAYLWNFGDGSGATGQSTTHTFTSAGSFSVSLQVSDGKKTADAPAVSVTVAPSMSGTWSGGTDPYSGASVTWTLTQTGSALTGSMTLSGALFGTITGVTGSVNPMNYPTAVTIATPGYTVQGVASTFVMRFSGNTNTTATSMTGTTTTTGSVLVTQPAPVQGTFTR